MIEAIILLFTEKCYEITAKNLVKMIRFFSVDVFLHMTDDEALKTNSLSFV